MPINYLKALQKLAQNDFFGSDVTNQNQSVMQPEDYIEDAKRSLIGAEQKYDAEKNPTLGEQLNPFSGYASTYAPQIKNVLDSLGIPAKNKDLFNSLITGFDPELNRKKRLEPLSKQIASAQETYAAAKGKYLPEHELIDSAYNEILDQRYSGTDQNLSLAEKEKVYREAYAKVSPTVSKSVGPAAESSDVKYTQNTSTPETTSDTWSAHQRSMARSRGKAPKEKQSFDNMMSGLNPELISSLLMGNTGQKSAPVKSAPVKSAPAKSAPAKSTAADDSWAKAVKNFKGMQDKGGFNTLSSAIGARNKAGKGTDSYNQIQNLINKAYGVNKTRPVATGAKAAPAKPVVAKTEFKGKGPDMTPGFRDKQAALTMEKFAAMSPGSKRHLLKLLLAGTAGVAGGHALMQNPEVSDFMLDAAIVTPGIAKDFRSDLKDRAQNEMLIQGLMAERAAADKPIERNTAKTMVNTGRKFHDAINVGKDLSGYARSGMETIGEGVKDWWSGLVNKPENNTAFPKEWMKKTEALASGEQAESDMKDKKKVEKDTKKKPTSAGTIPRSTNPLGMSHNAAFSVKDFIQRRIEGKIGVPTQQVVSAQDAHNPQIKEAAFNVKDFIQRRIAGKIGIPTQQVKSPEAAHNPQIKAAAFDASAFIDAKMKGQAGKYFSKKAEYEYKEEKKDACMKKGMEKDMNLIKKADTAMNVLESRAAAKQLGRITEGDQSDPKFGALDTADEEAIRNLIMDNPGMEDDALHELADQLGVEPDEAEEFVYSELQKYLSGEEETPAGEAEAEMDYGKMAFLKLAEAAGMVEVDPNQVIKGADVESGEHHGPAGVSAKIALDHLMETTDYYDNLHLTEDAGKKTTPKQKEGMSGLFGGMEYKEPTPEKREAVKKNLKTGENKKAAAFSNGENPGEQDSTAFYRNAPASAYQSNVGRIINGMTALT